MNIPRTKSHRTELPRIRISETCQISQECFKLRSAGWRRAAWTRRPNRTRRHRGKRRLLHDWRMRGRERSWWEGTGNEGHGSIACFGVRRRMRTRWPVMQHGQIRGSAGPDCSAGRSAASSVVPAWAAGPGGRAGAGLFSDPEQVLSGKSFRPDPLALYAPFRQFGIFYLRILPRRLTQT
jgi:hypothetical protein